MSGWVYTMITRSGHVLLEKLDLLTLSNFPYHSPCDVMNTNCQLVGGMGNNHLLVNKSCDGISSCYGLYYLNKSSLNITNICTYM